MTSFTDSRDIELSLKYNKLMIETDKYIIPSYTVNDAEISLWPRQLKASGTAQFTAGVIPGTNFIAALNNLVYGLSSENNTFGFPESSKQPALSYTGYVRPINTTQFVFENGGYWFIEVILRRSAGLFATGNVLKVEIHYSGDSGNSWTTVATNVAIQSDAGALPPMNSVMASTEIYVSQVVKPNQTQRIRFLGCTNNWTSDISISVNMIRRR